MNNFGMLRKRFLIAASATLVAVAMPLPASAAIETSKNHCLLTVIGKDANNTFHTAPERCFKTFEEVLKAAGQADVQAGVTPLTLRLKASAQLATSSIIGVHYDAANATGASLTVNGSTCVGGGLNVPLNWNDRISSTLNGCGTIQHFENTNYQNASFTTYGSGGWTSFTGAYLNNRTSSIKYF